MSYLGKVALKASDIRRLDVTSSTSATHTLTWTPPSEQSLIITINGVKQQNNYSISGVTLTLDTALVATDEMEVIGINDIGTTTVPGDGTVTTTKIEDDAVTADKLANSINTEIAANTAKVTNATHTGDVTGATALTIADDAVDIAMLSATGTADATTFLRGDNAWAEAGGGKLLQLQSTAYTVPYHGSSSSSSYVDTGLDCVITPTAGTSKIVAWATVPSYTIASTKGQISYNLIETSTSTTICEQLNRGFSSAITSQPQFYVSGVYSCSDTSELTFKTQMKLGPSTSGFYVAGYTEDAILTMILMEVGA